MPAQSQEIITQSEMAPEVNLQWNGLSFSVQNIKCYFFSQIKCAESRMIPNRNSASVILVMISLENTAAFDIL